MADSVKIVFESDIKGITQAETALQSLTKTEKASADQFKKNNTDYINYSQKRLEEIKKEEAAIERLRVLRKQSFNVEDIKFYNNEIKLAKQNIELLGGSYQTVSKGSKAFLQEQIALNKALKQSSTSMNTATTSLADVGKGATKAFGALRTLANIIPGIGISGLILFGYEALINLLEGMTFGLHDNEKAILDNKEAIDKLVEARQELIDQISSNELREAVAQGIISQAESNKEKAREKFAKQQEKNAEDLLKREKEISEELGIEGTRNIDSKLSKEAELGRRMHEFREEQDKLEKEQARALNSEIAAIDAEEFDKQKKKEEKERKKKHKEEIDDTKKLLDKLKDLEAESEEQKLRAKADKEIEALRELKIPIENEKFRAEAITQIETNLNTDLEELNQKRLDKLKEQQEKAWKEDLEARDKQADEELRIAEEQADDEIELIDRVQRAEFDIAFQGLNAISEINQISADAEIAAYQEKLDNKTITEEQFASEVKRIKRNAAQTDKALSLFNVALNTAEGVIKYLSNPVTAPLVPFVIATGAIQAALISAKPIPFAKGTKGVKGGQAGKDSVHALLMPDEMVVPVGTKRKYEPILNAIFDEKISPDLLNKLALEGKMSFGGNPIDQYAIKEGMKGALRDGIVIKNFPKESGQLSNSELKLLIKSGIING